MPTYSELTAVVGFSSKNAAYKLVTRLIDQGLVEKDAAGKLLPGPHFHTVPVLGTVTAGDAGRVVHHEADVSAPQWQERLLGIGAVQTIAAGAAACRAQQPLALVEAQHLGAHLRALGEGSDGDEQLLSHGRILAPAALSSRSARSSPS